MVRLTFATPFFLKTMKLRTGERAILVKVQMIGSNLVEVLNFFQASYAIT